MVDMTKTMQDLKDRETKQKEAEVRFVQIISHQHNLMALDAQGNLWELNVEDVDNVTGKVKRNWEKVNHPRKG